MDADRVKTTNYYNSCLRMMKPKMIQQHIQWIQAPTLEMDANRVETTNYWCFCFGTTSVQ